MKKVIISSAIALTLGQKDGFSQSEKLNVLKVPSPSHDGGPALIGFLNEL